MAHNSCLQGKSPFRGQQHAMPYTSGCRPYCQKTTAFVAAPLEVPEFVPVDSEVEPSEESGTEETEPASEEAGGLYNLDFLSEAPDGNWDLNFRLAQTMQADELHQSHCFICQSPDHLMKECPNAKKKLRALQPRDLPK